MVLMKHKIGYELNGKQDEHHCQLVVYGDEQTAMSKTVGVPCGIATQLVLDGKVTETGCIRPLSKEIYSAINEGLPEYGIYFQ